MIAASAREADCRSIMLLVLALVPVIGALAGSVAYWRNSQRHVAQLTTSNDPIELSHLMYTLVDDYQMARLSLEVAAWPEANDKAIERAAQRKTQALASLDSTEVEVREITSRIAIDIGVDSTVFLSMLTQLFDVSRRELTAQEPGAPIIRGLENAAVALSGSLPGRSFPVEESSDATLRLQRQLLYATFVYHSEVSQPLIELFEELDKSVDPSVAVLKASASIADDEEVRSSWTRVRFDQTLFAGQEQLVLSTDAYQTEPVQAELRESLRYFDQQRTKIATDLLTFMDLLRADTDLAYDKSWERVVALADDLRSQQRMLTAVGVLLTLLGVALLTLTRIEVRQRRRVEADHRDALYRLDSKAQTDPLTGALNRRRFDRVLQNRLDDQKFAGPTMLAYVDLDRFKALNDVWGRTTGDQVLQIIAQRLKNALINGQRPEVIRFGGDEFICFVSSPDARPVDAYEMGEHLLAIIREPIIVAGERHLMTATAGLAISDDTTTPDSLLLEADRSLMLGKRVQRGSTVTSDHSTAESTRLVKMLPSALQNGEITCHYQPVFSIATGEMLHVEALSRWQTRGGDSVSPATFVPLVEAFGMSNSLTRSVLHNISQVMHSSVVPEHIGFWFNVAPVELEEFDFADRLLDDIAALNLPAERIAIEITETAAIGDPVHFSKQVERLRDVGIEIAIDDFGSGYSPLGYLEDLPIDVVKIDRSLIAHIDTHVSNQQLLTGVIDMLQTQGRTIVAEGVERAEELDWLYERGVDMVQGYLTARPAAPNDLEWPQARVDGRLTPSSSVAVRHP